MTEIPKTYDPGSVEDTIYLRWESSGFFNPDNLPRTRPSSPTVSAPEGEISSRITRGWLHRLLTKLHPTPYTPPPFTIVMPPPNVTGTLHVGHAVMLAIEDIMIRFARMRGRPALWIPGTDHAAIATQAVVERKLIEDGTADPRRTLGREKFIAEVEKFASASHDRIVTQIKKMGASCDWSREAYTLDEARSLAVRTAFKTMYDEGLIYRGNRIVNWCPRCGSTLADDEVEYRETKTPFYYFKYGPVVIGTARPETKFQDKTIIVHPNDPRYQHLHGTSFDVEWIEGKVQANVIADPVIDPKFGTGAMTITPGHSFEDFDLAQKYNLPVIKIIDEEGNLTEAAGAFTGQNARAARPEIVRQLKEKGLVERIDEDYVHNLSVCYRCETPVEPLPTLQWFIDVKKLVRGKSLKDRMREVVANGDIKIIPERFTKEYFRWVDNLRDWCISRQIWFGHRIPVWYRPSTVIPDRDRGSMDSRSPMPLGDKFRGNDIFVGVEPPEGEGWQQDEDTLDTWFSSGLWTFSTLGWPTNCAGSSILATPCRKTGDLAKFHPTSVLETGYDILFFWIARMIMMTTYALGEVPFRTVYLHGLVRDEQGRKMSKSLGNVIDPLDMTQKYGADATRLSFVLGTAPGNDVKLSEAKIAGFRNFTNKLWNIARYILTVTGTGMSSSDLIRGSSLDSRSPMPLGDKFRGNDKNITLADTWILQELNRVTAAVTQNLLRHEFSAAGELLRDFTWGSLADWYLEISKWQMANGKYQMSTRTILLHCLDRLLRLWHPFMPFVTEAIWEKYYTLHPTPHTLLMIARWPEVKLRMDREPARRFVVLQTIVSTIRNIRANYQVEPAKKVEVTVSAGKDAAWLADEAEVIRHLARVEKLTIEEKLGRLAGAATAVVGTVEVSVSLAGLIDIEKERERIGKALEETRAYVNMLKEKLENKEFLGRAPASVVREMRTRHTEAVAKLTKLEDQLKSLG